MTVLKRELVKEQLNQYRKDLQDTNNRKRNCAFNSMAFMVQSAFKYDHLFITGHTACINKTTIVDPTVGCAWFYTGNKIEKIKSILQLKTTPDFKAEWFHEDNFRYWWDYRFKLIEKVEQKTLPHDWDIPVQIVISSLRSKESKFIGKFSDYITGDLSV